MRTDLPAVVFLLTLCGCGQANRALQKVEATSGPAVTVKAETVKLGSIPVEIKAIGSVESINTIAVKPHITGTLIKTHFEEGQSVQAGDTLFEIDPRPYIEAVRQWEANLARDKALLVQSEANLVRAEGEEAHAAEQLKRYERLLREGIMSREQTERIAVDARTRRASVRSEAAAVESARASIRAAEASLDTAKLNLAYCTIRSPVTGRTGSLLVTTGNLVKAHDADLVTIHQIAPAYVAFSVPEDKLAALRDRTKSGSVPVTAAIPGDEREMSRGAIKFLDNSVDTGTGTIKLKALFTNSDSRLWPGQFVNVRILLEERANAVVVPASAVQTGQAGSFVYLVKADETVEIRPVKLGPSMERVASIAEGLQPGDRVVTEGQLRLAPGMKVRAGS